jgi:hypothetical protein
MSGRERVGWGSGGPGPRDCGMNSAKLRSEARFELLSGGQYPSDSSQPNKQKIRPSARLSWESLCWPSLPNTP